MPLYAATHRANLVPIEYWRCIEGGAAKCIYGHSFNHLPGDWLDVQLTNWEQSQKEKRIMKDLLAMQPQCSAELCARALAVCSARDRDFLKFFNHPKNQTPDFESDGPSFPSGHSYSHGIQFWPLWENCRRCLSLRTRETLNIYSMYCLI